MAEQSRKRLIRKVIRPQTAQPAGTPDVPLARKISIAAAIIVVTGVVTVAFLKYTGIKRSGIKGPGAAADITVRAAGPSEAPPQGPAAVLASASIVPPKPTSGTPLAVAYEASNPGGPPLEPTFRWYVNGAVVQDGPSNSLAPGPYRKGDSIIAGVSIADVTITTAAVTVYNGQPAISSVSLGPENAVAGMVISASAAGMDPDGDPIIYTYQWRVNGNAVGAPGSDNTFSTAGLKKRDNVSVLVACTDGEAAGGGVASNTVTLQNQLPKILSDPPLELSSGLYSYQVIAKDPDGDALTYRLDRFPAGMAIDAATGLVRWALPRGVMFTGRHEFGVAVTVSDGEGGRDTQDFTIVIYDVMVN